jgi:ribose transport system substrate-binding protein
VASAFGVSLEISYCDWDDDAQRRIVPQVVERRPDGIILLPTSADHSLELAQLIHGAGIPLIMSNTNPETDGFNYILTWTGPDDWGQTRQVARHFGELIGDGGYAILQHVPGISAHYARCWGVLTELADTKPGAQCLAVAYPGFDPEKAKAQVVEWIRAYGSSLKGIYCADDASYGLGVRNALAQEGRNDIVVSAAGASSVGLQLVKEGVISGMSYQSAEGDGALAMKAMVDWFSGLDLAPLTYMPYELITRDNVEDFLPAQW